VVAVLHGAVVGGGLELAAAAHVRVAERSACYALPEGSRGIYVGGGGSVRLPPLIGVARMADMMLTGRTYSAEEGQAIGLTTYLVDAGKGFAKGLELAQRIAGNAPLTNFAVMQALPRIAAMDPASGYAIEALMSAIAQADPDAKARLKDFLEKRAPKVTRK
jgi:enoyl-CoA hydratase/carnithine racemase